MNILSLCHEYSLSLSRARARMEEREEKDTPSFLSLPHLDIYVHPAIYLDHLLHA